MALILSRPRSAANFAIARRWDGFTAFLPWLFLDDIILQLHIGIHLLQACILSFQFLHAGHELRVHAAVLGAPFVEGRTAHAVLLAKFRHRRAGLGLF